MTFSLPRLLSVLVAAAILGGLGCAGRPVPAAPVDPKTVFQVHTPLLNLLKCPSVTCEVLEDLQSGQKVAVLTPEIQGWVQVRVLPDGQEGFVLARFLGRD